MKATQILVLLILAVFAAPAAAPHAAQRGFAEEFGEEPGVTQMIKDYIAAGMAGDKAALAAMYAEEMRGEEGIDEALTTDIESLQAFGELKSVTFIDQGPGDPGSVHFYKVEFEEAACHFTLEVHSTSGLLEGLSFAPLPSRRFDSPRLERLANALQAGDETALTDFWAEVEGRTPLVEKVIGNHQLEDFVWVTYLWRSANEATERVVVGGGPDSGEQELLTRLEGTDMWYWTDMVPRDSRYTYAFVVNFPMISRVTPEETETIYAHMHWRLDPRNPDTFDGRSLIELPDAPAQPWSEKKPGVPAGTLTSDSLRSEILDEERQITIYTPPGHDGNGKRAGLLIVFDAILYGADDETTLVPTPTILDNLIHAGKVEPTVALLVHNTDRTRDLTCSEKFANFLALELVPWARDRFHATKKSDQTIVAGSSFGGLMSSCAALYHPKVFGNVLSQSGSYWYGPGILEAPDIRGASRPDNNGTATLYKSRARLPIRFYIDVGSFEGSFGIEPNRQLRDVLETKGYSVTYREFHGGHDYISWRGTLADGLLALVGTTTD